ncbi:histidine--tRNA ligase, partial [Flavobacteriaceae bacterium]|nr:histidine--tRNA ligase [Flavobacteriaceae bacterium]
IQPVWRADRPQHGRFQEFYQCDADIVGNRSLWQEIEMLSLYDNAFSKLKIEGVSLKINHRKILAGIAALLGAESKLTSFTVALDKLDKIGKEGVIKELKTHDFSENALHTLEQLLELKGSAYEQLETLEKLFDDHNEGLEGIHELKFILTQLEASPLEKVSLNFDLTLARGLHYYTGMIVEVSAPDTVKMGSIGGGGRYDDLTGTFGLKNMSGIGVSFGFERIFLVMDALGLFPETLQASAEVLFANFGDAAAAVAYHYVNELRTHGIACELYPTEAKLKKQLAYANDKKIAKVILIGSEELEQKQFVLKDMDTGNQTTYSLKKLLSLLS